MQQNKKIRDLFTFCNCPQIANFQQFFNFICKPIFLIDFFSRYCIEILVSAIRVSI